MIQDPAIATTDTGLLVEDWTEIEEDHYLDGPVTPRLAVVDLDPTTEQNVPGARFQPPEGDRTLGRYDVDEADIYSPTFIQVSVFATILRVVYMFEEPDTLGRKITWGFDAPQLLVVPRAGWWENAYYERLSHSLQFFSFQAGDQIVHTALSRDIVAHETAHALIDGIDRDLYDALDPQSLALHEGIADLVAMLAAFRSSRLSRAVLDKTNGSIEKSTAFSSIGEEFGRALDPSGKAGYLRSLLNRKKLDPNADPADEPEEHELSQVITGVLYEFVCVLHEDYKREIALAGNKTEFQASGEALFRARERFKRTILRALDYLPPVRSPSSTMPGRSWPPTRPPIRTTADGPGCASTSSSAGSPSRRTTCGSRRTSPTTRSRMRICRASSTATGWPTRSPTPTGACSRSPTTPSSRSCPGSS
jgi:hypothetical protein